MTALSSPLKGLGSTSMKSRALLTGFASLAALQASALAQSGSCAAGEKLGSDKQCHSDVKFHAKDFVTQGEIDQLIKANGWRMATPSEVEKAWSQLGLDVYAFGRMSDGRFAVPVQRNHSNFSKSANIGAVGGNQGFFYVHEKPSGGVCAPPSCVVGEISITQQPDCKEGQQRNGAVCLPTIKFHRMSLDTSGYDRVKIFARERGWVLASAEEVGAAHNALQYRERYAGYLADGRVASASGAFKIEQTATSASGVSQLTASPEGFFYVQETAVPRVQILPVNAPPPTAVYPGSAWVKVRPPTFSGLWSNNSADQHPARVLFGLGDAVLLRKAAARYLSDQGQNASGASVDAYLQSLRSDPEARYRFAPALLMEGFEALSTPNPNRAQSAFRKAFEQYMSYGRYRVDGITLSRWLEFNGHNPVKAAQAYGQGPVAGNLLPNTPNVAGFEARLTNPMEIGSAGLHAIDLLVDPAAAASLPEFRNTGTGMLGADFATVAAAVGAQFGGTAATVALVATAVAAGTGKKGALIKIVSSVGYIAGKSTGATSVGGALGIGIGVSVALTALITKAVVEQARADELDRKLKASVGAGPQPLNVYELLNSGDEGQRLVNRSAVFSYLLKMLVGDPADKGLLTLKQPKPPSYVDGYWTCGSLGKLHLDQTGFRVGGSHAFSGAGNASFKGEVKGNVVTSSAKALKLEASSDAGRLSGSWTPANGQAKSVSCTRDKPIGYVRMQNHWHKDQYVHNETGKAGVGAIEPGWWSAQWKIVPAEGDFVKFQNRWRTNEYLHIQNGKLEVGPLGDQGWWSAQWRTATVDGEWTRIQNRWKPDHYIHNQNGAIEAGPIKNAWTSAVWKIE